MQSFCHWLSTVGTKFQSKKHLNQLGLIFNNIFGARIKIKGHGKPVAKFIFVTRILQLFLEVYAAQNFSTTYSTRHRHAYEESSLYLATVDGLRTKQRTGKFLHVENPKNGKVKLLKPLIPFPNYLASLQLVLNLRKLFKKFMTK